MDTKPTKGAERAARGIRNYLWHECRLPMSSDNESALSGIIDRAIGLPALITAVQACMEFWDSGTPVHPGALVVDELRQAVMDATGIAGARYPLPQGGELFTRNDITPLAYHRDNQKADRCRMPIYGPGEATAHQCPRKPAALVGGYGFCKRHLPIVVAKAVEMRTADLAKARVTALMEG